MSHTENVRIDRHGRFAKSHRLNDIGRFSTDSRQGSQLFERRRHLTSEPFDQSLRQSLQMLRLVVGIAHRFDVIEQNFGRANAMASGVG